MYIYNLQKIFSCDLFVFLTFGWNSAHFEHYCFHFPYFTAKKRKTKPAYGHGCRVRMTLLPDYKQEIETYKKDH